MSTEMQVVPERSRATIPSDDVKEALEICEANLKEKATLLVEEFKEEQIRLGKGKPKEEWSRLGCRLVKKNASIYIEWYSQFWGRENKKGGKVFSKYLRREKNGFGYNLDTLKRYAASWEYELVETYESLFKQLRKYNNSLTKSRQALRDIAETEIRIAQFLEERTTDGNHY